MSAAEILSVLGIGVAVFASTNIDDILLLSVFFADEHLRARSVVLGQFLGIGALVVGSSVCALAALAVPEGWPGLLGVIPLGLGLWKLRRVWRRASIAEDGERDRNKELAAERRTRSQVVAVALVTVANGGDNLGVYIPLFARQPSTIPAYAGLFAVMTGVWCLLGYLLVNNRLLGQTVRRYGRGALPFVLVALGLYILAGARPLLQ